MSKNGLKSAAVCLLHDLSISDWVKGISAHHMAVLAVTPCLVEVTLCSQARTDTTQKGHDIYAYV